jgi:hypothetical protein
VYRAPHKGKDRQGREVLTFVRGRVKAMLHNSGIEMQVKEELGVGLAITATKLYKFKGFHSFKS